MPWTPPPPSPSSLPPKRRLRSDDLDRPFLPPERSQWPGRLIGGTLLIAALAGAFYGGQWYLENRKNIEFVPPWAKNSAPANAPIQQADPNAPPVPLEEASVRSSRVLQPGGKQGAKFNSCATANPDPGCPPTGAQPSGPSPESEISRIRAANAAKGTAELPAPREVGKGGTAHLEVGRTREQQAAAAAGVGVGATPADKGQECDFIRVRSGEIDTMLTQSYPNKVNYGLRDEQKRGRARMASLGC